jgi:DNA-binding ferritin-like protein
VLDALLDEQGGQILAMTDPIAERVRKLGARPFGRSGTLHDFSAFPTTTRTSSRRKTSSPSLNDDAPSHLGDMSGAHHLRRAHDVATARRIGRIYIHWRGSR